MKKYQKKETNFHFKSWSEFASVLNTLMKSISLQFLADTGQLPWNNTLIFC